MHHYWITAKRYVPCVLIEKGRYPESEAKVRLLEDYEKWKMGDTVTTTNRWVIEAHTLYGGPAQ